jgi:hypothetical protein
MARQVNGGIDVELAASVSDVDHTDHATQSGGAALAQQVELACDRVVQ